VTDTRAWLEDPDLASFLPIIARRKAKGEELARRLIGGSGSLAEIARVHEELGLHRTDRGWVFREWAPNATEIFLTGSFCDWKLEERYSLKSVGRGGIWELRLPLETLRHEELYRLHIRWPGGSGDRIPSCARRVVQDYSTNIFNAQVWDPPVPHQWQSRKPAGVLGAPLIYESHVGMAQEHERVGTYDEFREHILPRIVEGGYNTVQLMGVQEHPYYGSFGYHVSNFFAPSSRFGTPEELKRLIDTAHEMGLAVIIDLIHSHAVSNEVEGLSRLDGTLFQYFHDGPRGTHELWDSRCFDYAKEEVVRFLLSNCRYWLEEFCIDGFRLDGITSMLYEHHGLATAFTSYDQYFDDQVDEDAYAYLSLANRVIHEVSPSAITIAEDVSGMPGLGASSADGGCGFDYRLALGIPDCWFKLVNDHRDEDWSLDWLWYELTTRRAEEHTVSYVECHDQALVGGKSLIFELVGERIYDSMRSADRHLTVERGTAIHKLARLLTLATAAHGYLNFMGNEFGHPEWIDFPREGNNWSYHYARRQWSLRDNPELVYHQLGDFDAAILALCGEGVGTPLRRLLLNQEDRIIVLERNKLYYFFNFHWDASQSSYPVELPPGSYEYVFDSDAGRFGGQDRIAAGQRFFTEPLLDDGTLRNCVRVYLPCRTALVLKKC
jgi:1,4-alpha-glucan branching enzyme